MLEKIGQKVKCQVDDAAEESPHVGGHCYLGLSFVTAQKP